MLHAAPHPTPALRLFAWMCDCLRTAIGPHTRADTRPGQVLGFLWYYLGRASARLDKLFEKWRAGTLRPARPRPTQAKPREANPARIRLPQGKFWLVKRVQKAAIGQSQLQMLLLDEEFLTFLREVPAARRILRPLCLALDAAIPDFLRPKPRIRKPTPPKPKPAPEPRKAGKYPNFRYRSYSPGKPPSWTR